MSDQVDTAAPVTPPHVGFDAKTGAAYVSLIGFAGNEIAAVIRLRAGRRLQSPALVADGYHARTDGLVSLAVVATALLVAIGLQAADPIIGLVISVVIFRITVKSWRTIRADPRG